MGYEDVRVRGKINEADRCGLCGNLCSIDLFIETKCYHLFCAVCFASYLERTGKTGNIRDESNYTRPNDPVRCPVSARILKHKHSKGALYLKMKQYLRLSQYRIRCEFFPVGCYTEVKANKLSHHAEECFFTSRRVRSGFDQDHHLFQPNYTNNQLYEEVRLRTEPIDHRENSLNKRNWMGNALEFGNTLGSALGDPFGNTASSALSNPLDNARNSSRGRCSFSSGGSMNDFKRESYKNSTNHNLIDLRSECEFESIEHLSASKRKSEANRRAGSLTSASSVDLAGGKQTLFDTLMMDNANMVGSTASLKSDDFDELKRQLDLIQKNVNFIKEQMLPSYED